ncbi:MAG: LPS export ABC transporter periplasmic protein LptC, partial [Acidaminococcaceae bacterium]|nr:LPS export ABC transporter periplasmic protein LptC [Acidaminococcaceae bacterium]
MKNKNTILMGAAGLIVLLLIFAWLFWGSTVPKPTDALKKNAESTVKATVYNTELNRDENGKNKWKLKVGEAVQESNDVISAKNLDGIVYLSNGDEMHVTAEAGKISDKNNQFELS